MVFQENIVRSIHNAFVEATTALQLIIIGRNPLHFDVNHYDLSHLIDFIARIQCKG